MQVEKLLIGLRRRFRLQLGGDDVEHRLEMRADAEMLQHLVGVIGRAVGEHQLAPRQLCDRGSHRRIGLERRMVDLMDVSEVVVGSDAMQAHHAAHAGAVAAVVILLDPPRLVRRDLQIIGDIFADAPVDLLPQVDMMRIQRVVEIEHPGVDMAEAAFRFVHGSVKRRMFPPPFMSTTANPVAPSPRLPQSLWSLISNLLSRVQSRLAPPQFSSLSLNFTGRPSPSTASAKLKICFGWPATSGCRHLPDSMRYQPRLITVLPSSVPTAAMTLCGVSLHHVRPTEDGDCTASTMRVKKFEACTTSGCRPRFLRNAASAACVFGPSTPSIGAAS